MTAIRVIPDIPTFNGAATGTIRFETSDGKTLHSATGNWFSDVPRSRCRKAVAGKLHPRPKQKADETPELYRERLNRWQRRFDGTAAEVERLLLDALDRRKAEAERESAQAVALPPELAEEMSRGSTGCPYVETDYGISRMKQTGDGEVSLPLTNFTARITADVVRDDGAERQCAFEVVAKLGRREFRFTVPAAAFPSLDWAIENMGAGAIVYAGVGARDHARVAIQTFSTSATRRTIFCHTGWREVDGETIYLHAAGGIGKGGAVPGVEVDLSGALCGYVLPEPPTGTRLRECVQASLSLFTVGRMDVTAPGLCAVYRAALAASDASLHYAGPTGVFKSELAALLQQHFGAELDARHLPGSWSSTDNALEGLALSAKDALLVVDDFAPGGSMHDVQRFHAKADRVIRAAGNHSGRQRMRPDGTLRPNRPPRGFIISTGEDVPRGQSLRARMLVVEVGPGDVDPRG
jgi:hypothetical protein